VRTGDRRGFQTGTFVPIREKVQKSEYFRQKLLFFRPSSSHITRLPLALNRSGAASDSTPDPGFTHCILPSTLGER
jgi:hypothetical protein